MNSEVIDNSKEVLADNPVKVEKPGVFKKGYDPRRCMDGHKNTPLKDFSLKEFNNWTDEQKREFLKKISPIDIWKMTEGNPVTDQNIKGVVKIITTNESLENATDTSPSDNSQG